MARIEPAKTPQGHAAINAILSALPDAAMVFTRERRTFAFNDAAAQLFPALRENDPLERAIRAPNVLSAIDRLFDAPRHHLRRESVEWREFAPPQKYFRAHAQFFSYPNADPLALVIVRDMTAERMQDKMRVDFVANASHELRTPLASLLGFIETLQGPARNDAPAREKFLGVMAAQARRMARLIDDLLSLSRVEQRAHLAPSAPVDLAALAREACSHLFSLAQQAGVDLALSASNPAIVAADRDDLLRAIENLIENAVKYGAPGRVEISVRSENSSATLVVRDQGPGIAAHHLPRLTERFYRVEDSVSRAKGGTGLGLAIVKHIALRHRGRLAIESVLGQGATFTLILPTINK